MAAYTHDVLIYKFVSLVLPSQQRQATRWRSRSFVNVFAGILTCISFKFSSTNSPLNVQQIQRYTLASQRTTFPTDWIYSQVGNIPYLKTEV